MDEGLVSIRKEIHVYGILTSSIGINDRSNLTSECEFMRRVSYAKFVVISTGSIVAREE